MKGFVCFAAVLTVLALVGTQALAGPLVSQDWENGAGGWVDSGGSPAAAIVDVNGNHVLQTPGAISGTPGAKQFTLAAETGKNWSASWDFYTAGASREFVSLYSYSGLAIGSGTLQQVICLGVYDWPGVANYNFRIGLGTTGLDPSGWANTSIARTGSVWHNMRVDQVWNPGESYATLDFYVDNVLGATWTTTAVHGVTAVRMGSTLSNGGVGAYYDNFTLSVPEPGSLLALGSGLVALLGFAKRRRA